MARDRNFQRKQKDARLPARDSHGEDRMAARQGEPDYDLRRARDAPSSGTSRNRRQAAPVQTETYGSDIFAGCENSDTAAQDSPIQVFPGQEPTGSEPYAPETGPKDSGRGSQAQGNAVFRDSRQEEPRQADFSQGSPGRRNAAYQNFKQEEPRQADFSQESPGRRNAAYQNFRQEEPRQADFSQESPGRRNAAYQNFRQEESPQENSRQTVFAEHGPKGAALCRHIAKENEGIYRGRYGPAGGF